MNSQQHFQVFKEITFIFDYYFNVYNNYAIDVVLLTNNFSSKYMK